MPKKKARQKCHDKDTRFSYERTKEPQTKYLASFTFVLFCTGKYNLNSAGNSSSEYSLSEKYTRRMRQLAWICEHKEKIMRNGQVNNHKKINLNPRFNLSLLTLGIIHTGFRFTFLASWRWTLMIKDTPKQSENNLTTSLPVLLKFQYS